MLEKAPNNATHADPVAHAAHTRTQRAHPSHDQVNIHTRLRSPVQRGNDVFVQQAIHFGDDARRPSLASMLDLPSDQVEALLCQIERGNQQGIVVGVLGIGG